MAATPLPIKPGDRVRFNVMDGDRVHARCGPGIVIAMDGPSPGKKDPLNGHAVWMRFTNPDGTYNYRSCDICYVEKIPLQ